MARKQRWRVKLTLLLSFFAAYPMLMGAVCGDLFNKAKDNANITFTIERSIEFELDIDKYLDKSQIKDDGSGKIPAQAPTVSSPVEMPAQEFDISDHPDVQKYGSKVRYVNPQEVIVSAISNSANIDLPQIDVSMSEFSKDSFSVIGNLSGIPAGKTTSGENLIKSAGASDTIGRLLLQFKFKYKAKTTLVVKGGQAVPKGKIKLKIRFKVKFSVNPFK